MPTQTDIHQPQPGDVVLYSTDAINFSNPTLAWVTDYRGEYTANILTFTGGTFSYRSGVHRRDEPDLINQPGWQESGAWEFAPLTKAIYKLLNNVESKPAGK